MSEMTMRKRVAIALLWHNKVIPPEGFPTPESFWAGHSENEQRHIMRLAGKIIEAMREPTTQMLEAGTSAYQTPGKGFLIGAYNAMIDTAVKE